MRYSLSRCCRAVSVAGVAGQPVPEAVQSREAGNIQTHKGNRPNTALATPPVCDIQRAETPMA